MTTPWEQAQDFARSNWRPLKNLTRGRRPTRPLDVLDTFVNAMKETGLARCPCPAWVFMYLPKGSVMDELADNVAPAQSGRGLLDLTKLQSVKNDGGMVFLAGLPDERLVVASVALVRSQRLYVFDQPDGVHPPMTTADWERHVHD